MDQCRRLTVAGCFDPQPTMRELKSARGTAKPPSTSGADPRWWVTPRLANCGSSRASAKLRARGRGVTSLKESSPLASDPGLLKSPSTGPPRNPGRARAPRCCAWPPRVAPGPATAGGLPQVAGAEHHQPVLDSLAAVRRVEMPVARGLWLDAVPQIPGQVRAHQNHRDIEHRQVDPLAAAGPFTPATALPWPCHENGRANPLERWPSPTQPWRTGPPLPHCGRGGRAQRGG
jgi:hypothetical protein